MRDLITAQMKDYETGRWNPDVLSAELQPGEVRIDEDPEPTEET